ncbi:galactokinase [Ferrovibrio terrae]|uniref:Galactokinase n=1 Tax=Ferrovibrio terrae TaxID=2594003 RepID=A0A516GXX9_9PROT|nr:galactokinase [Ferrovibrio terrae]QDO96352.1 galactokinase [Ferrovibrio terrae]
MIITRSPLRITLGGGGTDLPSYYENHEGFLIAAAIDRYVYITIHRTFFDEFIVKYSKLEKVSHAKELEHPIIREALDLVNLDGRGMEITSMADIPAGTGLGSSGSFTTALLKALHSLKRNIVHPEELAEQACHIEIERLKDPIGKQDQYIAAYGGITCFRFQKDGKVKAWPLAISEETRHNLEDGLVMFFTGYSRRAADILKQQDDQTKSKADAGAMVANLHYVKDLGLRSKDALEQGDLIAFGQLMHEHWQYKKKRSGAMSNPQIDEWYDLAMRNGAVGGKLIGAGGGGFLMFYSADKTRLRHALLAAGLKEVRFHFDFEGTKVLAQ